MSGSGPMDGTDDWVWVPVLLVFVPDCVIVSS